MKKLIFILIAFVLVLGTAQAQDVKTLRKTAQKALGAFRLDNANKDKIAEAVTAAEALNKLNPSGDDAPDAYLLIGDVFGEIASQINTAKSLNLNTAEELPKVKYPEIVAFEAYAKALEGAAKKYHTKAALKGIREAQNYLSFRGLESFQAGDYAGARKGFKAMMDSHDLLKANDQESAIEADGNYNNQLYLYALAAYSSEEQANAKKAFLTLYDAKSEESAVYEYLYKIESEESNADNAYKYLEEGRKKFPEELGLLFAEINHFLKLGKSEELIDKIKLAIKAEPENTSLYNVLGNTYDNLGQTYAKNGDDEKAAEFGGFALQEFKKALQIEPENAVAVYSIGQIFYNKAALKTQQMQKFASDYSKEGMKQYEGFREEVFAEFDKALPFFQASEALDANDVNTLIALKEIYAKKDNVEMSNTFKERLETVQSGGTNAKSHFTSSDVNLEVELSKL